MRIVALVNASHVRSGRWARWVRVATRRPVHLSGGPLVGHHVAAPTPGRTGWALLSGSVANLVVAALAFGLFHWQPLPLLDLIAQVQIAAAAFFLVPFAPMDGHLLKEDHAVVMAPT